MASPSEEQVTVAAVPPTTSAAFATNAKDKISTTWDSVREMRPRRSHIVADLIAALTFAAVNIPQGLAYALMVGVNPVYGLNTLMIAPPIGALATSSVFMNVSPTSALAASAGDVLLGFTPDTRAAAMVTLVLMVGIFQLLLGMLKLGFIMQFVPYSVMIGFISGVAVLIILGQLGNFTGFNSTMNNKVLQTADLLLQNHLIVPQAVIVGTTTIVLILLFERNRFPIVRSMALFLAMAVASALPWLLQWEMVQTVKDVADIPQSLPQFVLPQFSYVPKVALSAAALGLLGLVQGASVAQTYPNPDGKFSVISRDFLGQGLANMATSFFGGIPAGGSSSSTAVTVNAGAQTRWANIFGGIFVLLIVLVAGNLAEMVAMPALAGLLIVVGARMINRVAIAQVWQTGQVPRASAGVTFAATLIAPLQVAILVGVLVALLLHVFQQSQKVVMVEMVWSDQTFPIERPAPTTLASNSITTLLLYGSVFFASAGTFEKLLPAADSAKRAVVILLLRGHSEVGSTFINSLTRYAQQLKDNQGKLVLVGISDAILTQLEKTGAINIVGPENVFVADERMGIAMQRAYSSSLVWLGTEGPVHPAWLDAGTSVDAASFEEPVSSVSDVSSDGDPVSKVHSTVRGSRKVAHPKEKSNVEPVGEAKNAYDAFQERLLYLEELERLAKLKDKGIVTEEEFTEKKHQILGI